MTTSAQTRALIMIIDDEAGMTQILSKSLRADGYETAPFTDPVAALEAMPALRPDLVLSDVRMPGLTGRELLERVKAARPEIPVLLMTAYGTIEDAVAMLHGGAFNYITKPFQHADLLHHIGLALRQRTLEEQVERLSSPPTGGAPREIVGDSPAISRVKELIRLAAGTDSVVMITGESGTGKELVAREIHRRSARAGGRFVAVNCPAVAPNLIESELFGHERGAFTGADRPKMGLVELSGGGTLFLDEIGELPPELQAKLLRVIQEREVQRVGALRPVSVDLRIVTATHRDLAEDVRQGRFREDLYYRLNVIPILVPPLRERRSDIRALALALAGQISRRMGRQRPAISEEALLRLSEAAWPGNVRELENTLERVLVMNQGEEISAACIPVGGAGIARPGEAPDTAAARAGRPAGEFKDARREFEREYFARLMRECGGNMAEAARRSGVSRRHLYEKLDQLELRGE